MRKYSLAAPQLAIAFLRRHMCRDLINISIKYAFCDRRIMWQKKKNRALIAELSEATATLWGIDWRGEEIAAAPQFFIDHIRMIALFQYMEDLQAHRELFRQCWPRKNMAHKSRPNVKAQKYFRILFAEPMRITVPLSPENQTTAIYMAIETGYI